MKLFHLICLFCCLGSTLLLSAQQSCYEQYLRKHDMPLPADNVIENDNSYDELKNEVILAIDTLTGTCHLLAEDGTILADAQLAMVDSTWYMWLSVDPLADKNIANTPYMYCGGNPIMLVDPDGRATFWADGEEIGNDGVDDGRILWLKTTQKYFGSEEIVKGAGIKRQIYKETVDFIKGNSGNTEAFMNNGLAYDNSVEMPITYSEVRQMMVDCIKDNGRGGFADANNREYGGSVSNYVRKVQEASPSAVDKNRIEVGSPAAAYIPFHSHWSGNKDKSLDPNPSPGDLMSIVGKVGFVFGMGDGTVYFYNSNGVQATCPMRYFVNPKK